MTALENAYRTRFGVVLTPLAIALEQHVRDHLSGEPRIDRVTARAKSIDRFMTKALKIEGGAPKYSEPLSQIQDQIGARIITFYLSDVERISNVIEKYYRPIEIQRLVPESEWKFGYFGLHFVLHVPSDLVDLRIDRGLIPEFFELQIKTMFQHAWSEAEHDLGYKPEVGPLDPDETRRLAFTSAQAWGADRVFEELFQERIQQI